MTTDMSKEKIRRGPIIDLAALPVGKARSQAIVCIGAALTCMVLAFALVICGAYLPLWVETVTPVTVWISMGMEAAGLTVFAVSRWISRNALAKEV